MSTAKIKVVFDPNSNDEGVLYLGGQKLSVCCLGIDEKHHIKEGQYEMLNIYDMPPETILAYGVSVAVFTPISGDAKLKFATDSKPLIICSGDTDSNGRLYRCNNGIRMYASDLRILLSFLRNNKYVLEVVHKKNGILTKLSTKNVSKHCGSQIKPVNARGLSGFYEDEWGIEDYLLGWIFYLEMCDSFDSADYDDYDDYDLQEEIPPEDEDYSSAPETDNAYSDLEDSVGESSEGEIFSDASDNTDRAPLITDPFEKEDKMDEDYSPDPTEAEATADFTDEDDYSSDGDTDY